MIMNENLNLVEILKDCPKGTKLYCTIYGYVTLDYIDEGSGYPICIKHITGSTIRLTSDGKIFGIFCGECILFPSREQRDWSKFKLEKPKFDPKTLQPFDRVLVKVDSYWRIELFSNMYEYMGDIYYACARGSYKECIPYNDETKHLLGTRDEAPEYYRYWKD